jgi:ABC-type multidrug transport system ATPase subunit
MMSVVGVFDKQLPQFKSALESIGLELSKDAFLQYMRNTYGTSVKGLIKLIKLKSKQDSIITLYPFEKDAVLYRLKDHSTPDQTYICKVGTLYEQSEKEYVKSSCGCVWCHAPVTEDLFEVFVQEDNTDMLKQAYREAIPLVVNLTSEVLPTSAPVVQVQTQAQVQVQTQVQVQAQPEERKVVVVLTGITGAGKSTIINLLNRFYEIDSGKITIDAININDFTLETLRNEIAMVLQDVFLFADSIYNNITLFDTSIQREEVYAAAKKIGIHDFLMSLPNGYEYDVKERGVMLSSGQRQLIAFLRAYISNPSILILDEATSSIDSYSEELIQKATQTLTQGRTSIIIAHRLATIVNADTIIVMDKGIIVEKGKHKELLQIENGFYKKLYEAQFEKTENRI